MELRSVWAQELDEDPVGPGAAGPGAAMIGAVDPPSQAIDEEPPADEQDGPRRGSAVAWLAALTVLALLLMTLGWWLGRGDGPLSPGVSSGAAVTSDTVPAGEAGAADGTGVTVAGAGGGTTLSGGSGGTGGDGANGGPGSTGSGAGGAAGGATPGSDGVITASLGYGRGAYAACAVAEGWCGEAGAWPVGWPV